MAVVNDYILPDLLAAAAAVFLVRVVGAAATEGSGTTRGGLVPACSGSATTLSRDKQAQLAQWFNGLMNEIEPNLLTKNRDRFTQNLSMFRRDINDLLRGAVSSQPSVNDMMTS